MRLRFGTYRPVIPDCMLKVKLTMSSGVAAHELGSGSDPKWGAAATSPCEQSLLALCSLLFTCYVGSEMLELLELPKELVS